MAPPSNLDRRSLFKLAALGATAAATGSPAEAHRALADKSWPVLKHYDQQHTPRFALPIGGIGTGTFSLFGNGSLRDWEVMSRPGKGFVPTASDAEPFFAIHVRDGEETHNRILEGPLPKEEYEGSHGSRSPSSNLPRFRNCEVAASYPFARVMLRDEDVPVDVDLKAFNPMVPADTEASGIPIAALTYEIRNKTGRAMRVSVCGSLPNFVGVSGWTDQRDWKGDRHPTGGKQNRNVFRRSGGAQGLFMDSQGVERSDEAWGSLALATTAAGGTTHRTTWSEGRWGVGLLDFWDDFSVDGRLDERESNNDRPVGSLAVEMDLPADATREVTFLIAWHFPNRYGWNVDPGRQTPEDQVGNYYTTVYDDAWDVIAKTAPKLGELRERTVAWVNAFLASPVPDVVKEAALFNASTLRTQTCFRTRDGRFFGWEGCADQKGCCQGSCTHVWNYEQTTAFLYGSLALSMREVEFGHATDDKGLMSFRVRLPLERAQEFGRPAADGQMGCLLKMHRDWQLSGDDATLRKLWPKVRKALEFCWIEGGWDADKDGVMEGVQHNTMDVEYFGPNPEMGFWYLGALRAGEEMARSVGDDEFAQTCRELFESGSKWLDAHTFNGEYYVHEVRPVKDPSKVPEFFTVGMGAADLTEPDYQLATGCLADQLVGQSTAHVSGLGHLADPAKVRAALAAVWKYNHRDELHGHFNPYRTFAMEGEPGLLIADYPKERPEKPFPYFGEVWTGIEYTAAAGMFYEGLYDEALACVRDARSRYDGLRRSPYDEAECGHHYARAMAAWALFLALTGFRYSAVEKAMVLADKAGAHFWSNGYAWGVCEITSSGQVSLGVSEGTLALEKFELAGRGEKTFSAGHEISGGQRIAFRV